MHLKEITFFDLDIGIKVTLNISHTLYIMWPIHLQSFKLEGPKV